MVATELVGGGMAPIMVAAAVDEHNEVAAKISGPLASAQPDRGRRTEGAAALVLEAHAGAADRTLAVVHWGTAWRGTEPSIPAPELRAQVILVRDGDVPSAWRDAPCAVVSERAGDHESVGGVALVAAVATLAAGDADEVLVLGRGPDRGYAWILRR